MAVEELYTKFSTGKKPTGDDFKELIDFRGEKGEKGDQGLQGLKGDTGATGAGLTGTATAEPALATDADLATTVLKVNSIIAKLKARGVVL